MNSHSRITVAYIAIGAYTALRALEPDLRCKLADSYGGEIGIIDEVTQYYALIDYVYDALTPEEREPFGVWDYEVSETFGHYCIQMFLTNQQSTMWNALHKTLSPGVDMYRLYMLKTKWDNDNADRI